MLILSAFLLNWLNTNWFQKHGVETPSLSKCLHSRTSVSTTCLNSSQLLLNLKNSQLTQLGAQRVLFLKRTSTLVVDLLQLFWLTREHSKSVTQSWQAPRGARCVHSSMSVASKSKKPDHRLQYKYSDCRQFLKPVMNSVQHQTKRLLV